jgi:hypothetical protein
MEKMNNSRIEIWCMTSIPSESPSLVRTEGGIEASYRTLTVKSTISMSKDSNSFSNDYHHLIQVILILITLLLTSLITLSNALLNRRNRR